MHLYGTPDGNVAVETEFDDGSWGGDETIAQSISDEGVRKNWNFIYAAIEEQSRRRNDGRLFAIFDDKYDPRGDIRNGLNCENLATWILTGESSSPLGAVLGKIADILGLSTESLQLSARSWGSSRSSSKGR